MTVRARSRSLRLLPALADLVSDNNFAPAQFTQFLLFAVER